MTLNWDTLLTTPRTFTSVDPSGHPVEITVTPKVRDRVRDGQRRITVTVLALLTDSVAAISNPDYRAFAVSQLGTVRVVLQEHADPLYAAGAMRHVASHRCDGRVRTSYNGEAIVPTSDVLDLGERLWDHFFRPPAS
ncbi:hypothetical protein [Streptomyces flavofungini]|uniref:hypothetical protein n=1 Tax=Streptomyces flavofungini TaxID=68200 RepID=UPI0025AEF912|nr:hypothetical protein [Streptomyces flavofungini]WJV44531.1 hypothetical protein QUY26_02685 [Streptomyces flavofungini]